MLSFVTMSHSIKEICNKIKHFYTDMPLEVLFSIIVILVGFSAFGLGRLSVLSEDRQSITPLYNPTLSKKPVVHFGGMVVVSAKGTKYHYPWCSGALRMNERNKRWYNSIEDARNAGYSPAGNCKGLQ